MHPHLHQPPAIYLKRLAERVSGRQLIRAVRRDGGENIRHIHVEEVDAE
jgi:hypothetical protein